MYEFVEPVDHFSPEIGFRRVGRGHKCEERLALERLPVGKAVNIPKDKAGRGAMQNWVWAIGKQRGVKLSLNSFDKHWHVVATSLAPTP